MIALRKYQDKKVGIIGLAKVGTPTVLALIAAGICTAAPTPPSQTPIFRPTSLGWRAPWAPITKRPTAR
jgi:hypothetical protein